MFGRGKKTGEVGINKEADREIILWITQTAIDAIRDGQLNKLADQRLTSTNNKIPDYNISAANKIWKDVPVSTICGKFLEAYKKKKRSESKNLILPYFEALETILDAQNEYEPNELEKLLNAYRDLAKSQIANRRALLNLTTDTGSKLKTAMNQQLEQMNEILKPTKNTEKEKATEKEIELDQTKFFELLNKIITDLQENYSWAILERFGDDLSLMISYFEKAYLPEEKLTVTHPKYSCNAVTEDCILRAYPVLKKLSDKITEKQIEDSRFEDLNKFLEGACNELEKETTSMYEPESEAPERFDSDLGKVMLLLSY